MSVYAQILKNTDIFYNFSAEQLELVAVLCQERTFALGDIVFLEGSKSDELYIIAHGEVDILLDPSLVSDQSDVEYPPVTVATLRMGQSFGEIALVDHGLRSATARAAQNPTRLLIIPSNSLREICDANPALGYRLMRNLAIDLALKLRSTDLRIREVLSYRRINR